MTVLPDIACRHCGATKGFFVNVEVRGNAWCAAEIVVHDDGKLEAESDGLPRDVEVDVEHVEEVGCAGCDKRVPPRRIDELIGPRYVPAVGDRVTLPDGLDGSIDLVLPPRWKNNWERDPMVYVLIGGREYATIDLTPIGPNPDQLDLLAAA